MSGSDSILIRSFLKMVLSSVPVLSDKCELISDSPLCIGFLSRVDQFVSVKLP